MFRTKSSTITQQKPFVWKPIVMIVCTLLAAGNVLSQVGISTTNFTPDASSMLELRSTSTGFLPPRMTTTERDAIASPAKGLVLYNTTTNKLNHYTGTAWETTEGASAEITGVTNASVNTDYNDSKPYWSFVSTAVGFPATGFLSGTRKGTIHVQRLQAGTESFTYSRYWIDATSSWSNWVAYLEASVAPISQDAIRTIDFARAFTFTITPDGNKTWNATNGITGGTYAIIITATGITPQATITFGTNFRTSGTLSTGSQAGRVFVIRFTCVNGIMYETSRATGL